MKAFRTVDFIVTLFAITISITVLATLAVLTYAHITAISGAKINFLPYDAARGEAVLYVLDSMMTVVVLFIGYEIRKQHAGDQEEGSDKTGEDIEGR